MPDGDSAAHRYVRSEPHIVFNGDRAGVFIVEGTALAVGAHIPVAREERMHGRDDGNVRPDKTLPADLYRRNIQNSEVEIGKKVFPLKIALGLIPA